ncbi:MULTISPECIES: GGDEF domain-containing protein [unclassified Herbaspirillum]|uniref:GGDEF domain-containing protein n=1 Tax=unclassified Herbaspirillum TaxID=2624150 RepID=UPI00114E7585|nr:MULTISPECIES: GGDEF domain-containing protein [unclassified Herbaspirillum]MBB5392802.1 EAL domain-containing protein (putative c-di-GMP-specific phosphodiesterase class I)/GGDEF domain-containing protein [Herbaspirillum sp. SJZ102]TQK04550.1 diguanylate cyclase (GGDEF)-like protein [Herbaspirillum sp. SJZ130]TQK09664.1 diguanylate cyclase (GGDEF)-like protein [Herbaspirillum sp. SJZ106]TWC64082.1 diguanylate cyclase (GGDEF)-like protein [Herbaspirillum sp. SJZ099]
MAPLSNASFPLDAEAAELIARAAGSLPPNADDQMLSLLHEIIAQRKLTALFQPIVRMRNGEILGYEGLIRGPSNTPLHSPLALFKVARTHNLSVQMEYLCRHIVLTRFAQSGLPGNLFLNVTPGALMQPEAIQGETLRYLENLGVNPQRIIIELTENEPTYDYALLRNAAMHYRDMGFQIAIDDLGEGFSSLRLWSELQPEYVKIDMHFVQGINHDPMKLQFVRSIQEIAEKSGSIVIAEGIESQAELLTIRDLGIACGQGYHIARPMAEPPVSISEDVTKTLRRDKVPLAANKYGPGKRSATVFKLLRETRYVTPEITNDHAYDMFVNDPQLQALPVVSNGLPIGLINRYSMVERFARLYGRELYGKKSCAFFMDPNPILTEQDTSLQDLSNLLVQAESHHLSNGFIITDRGQYVGLGTGHDLLREITQMQIDAARHANPLTQLPGNVPINDHIEYLLQSGVEFCICYCDLDHFKPFNDVYGYRKGDDMIQLTGRILQQGCDPQHDFIGHIGGDDFLIMFQSEDWERRCRAMLDNFTAESGAFYYDEDRERGGYFSEDRQGNRVLHPLVSISLGAVKIEPAQYSSPHQIASAATRAKKQAKKTPGNSLFIERRIPMAFSWALNDGG